MGRSVMKVVMLAVMVVGGWIGLYVYEQRSDRVELRQEQQRRKEAEARVEQLKSVVQHLTSEQRVADVLVTDVSGDGTRTYTTLLFQEYARDGSLLPPRRFTIEGNEAHLDAMVIKFQGKYVEANDPLRGRSIALFTKLFDDKHAPEKGYVIDEPGHIPAVYRGADPKVSEFEQQLWRDFWKLAQDKTYREQMGVDVLQGKSLWWRFEPGNLYTITLQADADLNLRWEPIKGIYKEMLKGAQTRPTTTPVG